MNKLLKTYIPLAALLLVGGAVTAQVKVDGNVYGGGNKANVKGSVTVIINQGGAKVVYDVYGGGALADVNVTTENNVSSHTPNTTTSVTITKGTVGRDVYGGGLGQKNGVNGATSDIAALVYGPVEVNIEGGTVTGSVFGCNNVNGAPQSTVEVTVNGGTVTQSVYGGGNLAAYSGSPVVTINGGTVAQSVFGGGNLAKVTGSTTVTVSGGTVKEDVYGGGALADVGTFETTSHTVYILDGTIQRAVYGGGLGDGDHEAKVNGEVTVNIGTSLDENGGSATLIGANVFGGNNANGSPQDKVTVHIWKTAHTSENIVDGTAYAINDVFGGGNEADYVPAIANKQCLVHVHGCENTISRTFGGGNAADVGTANDQGAVTLETNVQTIIEGGRIGQVFGGGNGEEIAANINGDLSIEIHGGDVGQFYGASNENGIIRGNISVDVDSEGGCGELTINELFSGSNLAPIVGNLVTTIDCSNSGDLTINNLYGGCNQANIENGSVTLNVYGGHYINVYGGSCGTPDEGADIDGNVTLNLYGGTIENAFGGSNVKGNIAGTITVNVIDIEGECPLYVTNIYGGSNMTSYSPGSDVTVSPVVNVVHAKNGIAGNVYGGSKGVSGTEVDVNSSPLVNIGYNSDMNAYLPSTYLDFISTTLGNKPRAIVAGDVYGGGDAATVVGNTKIMLRNRAKVFGNVYGGGNMGEVTGNTKVIVNGDNE